MKILGLVLLAFALIVQSGNQQSQRFPDDLTHSPSIQFPRKLCEKCPESVSIIQLIATPERFDGHFVRAKGYTSLEFEEYAIYLSRGDYEDFNTNDGLWISFAEGTLKSGTELKELQGKLVVIEGIFRTNCFGHMGSYPGCISDITRIESRLNRAGLERTVRHRGK